MLTVILTMIIPKLNHMIQIIINPCVKYLQQLEKEIYWGFFFYREARSIRLKKKSDVPDYSNGGRGGGVKMICDVKFVRALKSTWIRITLWKRGKDFIVNLHIYNKISNNYIGSELFSLIVKTT